MGPQPAAPAATASPLRGKPCMLRVGMRLREETPDNPSAIVLEKPLDAMERDLASMRKPIFGVTLSFVVVAAGLTWLLTRRYVSRPPARMVADMRSVRAGNLSLAHPTHRADEVGDARVEFDYLVRDLDAARIRADQEAEARRAIERGLQDADKLITLGQLAAVMAHEIGSPLQIPEGRTRALRKHAEDSDATRRTADLLVEQTGRITRIVEQMLSITRSCRETAVDLSLYSLSNTSSAVSVPSGRALCTAACLLCCVRYGFASSCCRHPRRATDRSR